jgi:MFS family permease
VTCCFLILPYGISTGFLGITLPFLLTRAGFSVAASASIVALGISANVCQFIWGPVADLTLTPRRWYLIGLATCALTLLLLSIVPLRQDRAGFLMLVVFISQVATTLVSLPTGALMAHTVAEEEKGRAAGWYQAGNLGGAGLGGGAGVWLASHFSNGVAGAALSLAMLGSAAALYFVSDVRIVVAERFGERMRTMANDILAMLRSPVPLLTIVLVASPIGAGAANNVWSAVAPAWHASANTVALVTGVLNGVLSAIGCVAGGWVCDRFGRWWAYFGFGTALALVAIGAGIAPKVPGTYIMDVLFYGFFLGAGYAAFSALVLHAIGRGVASTKYAILSSLGNLPVAYMTALDGWVHDRFGLNWMLFTEALLALVCIAVGTFVLRQIQFRQKSRTRGIVSEFLTPPQ